MQQWEEGLQTAQEMGALLEEVCSHQTLVLRQKQSASDVAAMLTFCSQLVAAVQDYFSLVTFDDEGNQVFTALSAML